MSETPLDAKRSAVSPASRLRARAVSALKVVILIGLVAWAHQRGLLLKTVEALKPLELRDALGACLALGVTLLCGVIRWRWILRALHLKEPSVLLGLRLYYEGLFYNTFAPGAIGGDVLRAHWLKAHDSDRSKLHYLVTLGERGLGLATLGVLGAHIWGGLTAALATVLIGAGLIYSLPRLHPHLREISPAWIVAAAMLNVASHLISFLIYLSLARSLGVDLPLAEWFEVLTITVLAANLPVSIAGLGPREAALISTLGTRGVGEGAALALSLGVLATLALHALLGGAVHLVSGGVSGGVAAGDSDTSA